MDPDREQQRADQPATERRLTEDEWTLLMKVCQRYRSSIPTYIQSGERERSALDALIKKLASWTAAGRTP